MRQTLEISSEIRELGIAPICSVVLPSAAMTTRHLLAASLKALFHQRGVTGVDASKATGIDNATISKFQLPNSRRSRWPRSEHFDALAKFFAVAPYVLLKPDEVVSSQFSDTLLPTRHTSAVELPSALPLGEIGGADVSKLPNPELLPAFVAYWSGMSAEARYELIGHALRLASEKPGHKGAQAMAGFR